MSAVLVEQHLRKSNIVEVVSTTADSAGAVTIVVRALHDKSWIRMMSDLLRASHNLESFGLEVHKVFYAEEQEGHSLEVRFAWMLLCWGELDVALESALVPILSRRLAAPPSVALARTRQKSPTPASTSPLPSVPVDEDAPDPVLVTRARTEGGVHRVKLERHVDAGEDSYDVYSIPLPHVHKAMFEGKKSEVITMHSGRNKFKATVQGRGEEEFAPSKGSL